MLALLRNEVLDAWNRVLLVKTAMKKLFHSLLLHLVRVGSLTVTWPDGSSSHFTGAKGPQAAIKLRNFSAIGLVTTNADVALGEAYMNGGLVPVNCSIFDVLEVITVNRKLEVSHPVLRLMRMARQSAKVMLPTHNPVHVRKKVAHHYDIDSRFYRLVFDRDQHFSCAYFERGDETLEEAQLAKIRHIGKKLCLDRPEMTVLDIGCGWGGVAIKLASEFGARVFGISQSLEQVMYARESAQAAGLSGQVRFELAGFRSMEAVFDRVVSVAALEHVGWKNYDKFYGTIRKCLAPDGVAVVQHSGRTNGPGATNRWMQKYIFPRGYSPALSETIPAIEKAGLVISDVEVLRGHYVRTISHWRGRFEENREEIVKLYDERFCRMYEYYMAVAELAFIYDYHVAFQVQLSTVQSAVPFTRDYLYRGSGGEEVRPVVLDKVFFGVR